MLIHEEKPSCVTFEDKTRAFGADPSLAIMVLRSLGDHTPEQQRELVKRIMNLIVDFDFQQNREKNSE